MKLGFVKLCYKIYINMMVKMALGKAASNNLLHLCQRTAGVFARASRICDGFAAFLRQVTVFASFSVLLFSV